MVICDRFYHASMAYQGYGRGIPLDFITRLTDLVCDRFRPEITILLDIDPGMGLTRARTRNHGRLEDEGRFEAEDLEFYTRVRNGYLELASRDPRIRVIDADRSIEDVHRDIVQVLELDSKISLPLGEG
jgi:dTMP kinase